MTPLPTFEALASKFPDTDKTSLHSYHHIYPTLLEPRRLEPLRILEVGVRYGGSLKLWREFFPNAVVVVGVDNGSEAGVWKPDVDGIVVVTADSTDPESVKVLAEYGPFDLIIDDGDHRPSSQIATYKALSPYLAPGAIYVIEDLEGIVPAQEVQSVVGGQIADLRWVKERHDDILILIKN